MKKIILGFSGLIASGKGTVAAYMRETYGASSYRYSTILRDALDRFYLPHTRDNLITLSEIMRQTFGEDLLAKAIAHDAEKDENPLIIVEGIRRMADIDYLQKLPNFVLVEIAADPTVRFERLKKRSENEDDQTKSYDQFLKDHEKPTELSIPEVLTHATEHIDNNGDEAALHAQLDALVKKYQVE